LPFGEITAEQILAAINAAKIIQKNPEKKLKRWSLNGVGLNTS
jgi:hypothetical protein